MTNREIADIIEPKVSNRMVICDSSEPKSIEEIRRYGINARGAEKWKGSIEFGIKKLQEYKIIIDVSCINAKNEFQKYKYKEDRNGNVLPIPTDKDNHLIDALRYAMEVESKQDFSIW